jgi:plastocyanin
MEERETQARRRRGGRGSGRATWLLAASAAAVAALAVTAGPAGSGVAESAVSAAEVPVTVSDFQFSPSQVTITQGDTVVWTSAAGSDAHNVVIPMEGFEQPSQPAGPGPPAWPVRHTFNEPGTYTYFCRPHQGFMRGTVVVEEAPAPPGTPPPGPGTPPGPGNPPPGGGGSGGGGGGSQPGGPSTGSPGAGKSSTKVTLKVSDATPDRGDRVRFFGTVRPAQDGRLVQLQRRVGRSYRTVAKIKLTDAGSSRSQFSKRIRVLKDSVFRARLPGNSAHAAGASGTKRVNVR